jgi:coenzyme F420-0:L-glutamate ligase / coenzyme F420-1:gamma-L-glutamate ligase
MTQVQIFPLAGLPEISEGDDLAHLIVDLVHDSDIEIADGDVFVIAQKIVSKAEGRVVRLDSITPSERARDWAREWAKDARVVELVLRESKRIVKMERGIIIAETVHGFICANAGLDVSNAEEGTAILLPEEPDASARQLQTQLATAFATHVGVIVSDTFGRAWREGLVNVALGVAGLAPLIDYRGLADSSGKILQATIIAIADEIASAAELVMGKAERVPVAIVRGARLGARSGSGTDLIRPAEKDLFR